jgi:hypothetical protein
MRVLEINLKNPIGLDEIDDFKNELSKSEDYDFLIIDTGTHGFEAIEVIKYFKDQFVALESRLSTFKKIALIRPTQYKNQSTNPEVYDFFDSKEEAKKWFLK